MWSIRWFWTMVAAVVVCINTGAVVIPPYLVWSKAVTGDSYVFIGNTLHLECTLAYSELTDNFTASDIFFIVVQLPQENTEMRSCVNVQNIHALNDTTASLTLPNATVADAGIYYCYVGHDGCTDSDAERQFIAMSEDVYVEYPPHNVTEFGCVKFNFGEKLTCSWQHPVPYLDMNNINVTMVYVLRSSSTMARNCPQLVSGLKCVWNESSFLALPGMAVEVNVTNLKTRDVASKVFPVSLNEIVQPAPVINLSVEPTESPGCLKLSWDVLRKSFGQKFRIKECDGITENACKVVVDDHTSRSKTICGYATYSWHNLSVESYPLPPDQGFWSTPVYAANWTRMIAPALGPKTTNGSFISTECKEDTRDVTFYWQKVELSAQNGLIDSYHIRVGKTTVAELPADTFLATLKLSCASVTVQFFAHNEAGFSLRPSVLIVASNISVPEEIQKSFAVEILNSTRLGIGTDTVMLKALWTGSETTDTKYTVFRCRLRQRRICDGEISWYKVPSDQSYLHIPPIPGLPENYIYGISMDSPSRDSATQIFWTDCLFHSEVDVVPRVDHMEVEAGPGKIIVTWNRLQCTYQSQIRIDEYHIIYCQGLQCSDPGKRKVIKLPGMNSSHIMDTVEAKEYRLTMVAQSGGKVGEEVQPWMTAVPTTTVSASVFDTRRKQLSVVTLDLGLEFDPGVSHMTLSPESSSIQMTTLGPDLSQEPDGCNPVSSSGDTARESLLQQGNESVHGDQINRNTATTDAHDMQKTAGFESRNFGDDLFNEFLRQHIKSQKLYQSYLRAKIRSLGEDPDYDN